MFVFLLKPVLIHGELLTSDYDINPYYRKVSNISGTKSQNLNASRLTL